MRLQVERGLRGNVTPTPRVSKVVALFLLAQVFLILSFPPLVHTLARTLLHAGASLLHHYTNDSVSGLDGLFWVIGRPNLQALKLAKVNLLPGAGNLLVH